jgi:hypothetical protein
MASSSSPKRVRKRSGLKSNTRMLVTDPAGGWRPRVFKRAAAGRKSGRLLVKCGCCDERVEVYHDDHGLEINGVYASLNEWREILMPLLQGRELSTCT